MGHTFIFPPHPSEILHKPGDPPQVHLETSRDPHNLPIFDTNGEPTTPILYLPPLLSPLPHIFPSAKIDPSYPPLTTETRLPDIDPASLSLHKALHRFRPLSDAYADVPYAEGFNWGEIELPVDDERKWYIVVFRSIRKNGSDGGPLYEADKLAHEEAVQNGGVCVFQCIQSFTYSIRLQLIMYWYGIPNPQTGMNLATCIWQSRKHAIAANSRPHHVRAMKLAAAWFEVYTLERHTLRKVKGQKGVIVEPFAGGDVGW